MVLKSKHMHWSVWGLVLFIILLTLFYWQPWKVFTKSGAIYVLLCDQQYESESVWGRHKKSTLFDNEKKCKTPQLSAIKLNYKVFAEKQKVVFSGKEIGIVSYECDIYDRNNFICHDRDIGVENGKAQLYFSNYETTVPKWRYLIVKFRLFLDKKLNNESVYVYR